MSTTTDLAATRRSEDNATAKADAEALSLLDGIDVPFGQWVKVEYEGSLEKIYSKFQQGDTDIPFSNMIVGGTDTSYTGFGSVKLENNDDLYGSRKSGYFKCVLREGWMTTIDVRTENEDYFYDNLLGSTERSMLAFDDSPLKTNLGTATWDEQISFTFMKSC